MILRTSIGKSFKGVGQYVLHDKGAQSAERVDFIETENLSFDDGQRAIGEMIHTATNQKALRRRAGQRATKTNNPVYHLSMSWETSETPSLADQMDAARGALKSLGLEDRQALIVGHTDTDNPHIHVVVNLVHPETGETAKLSKDHLKLSKWAEKYRRDRGQEHLCPQRQQNNDRRSKGEFVKAQNMTRREYVEWKKAQTKTLWDEFKAERAEVRESRKGEYDALWQEKENRFAARKAEIKELYKPKWSGLFKAQRDELKDFDTDLGKRMKFALRQSKLGRIKAMFQAVFASGAQRVELVRHHEEIRAQLAQDQKSRIADASRTEIQAYKHRLAVLKESHQQQNQDAFEATKAKSADIWKRQDVSRSGQDFDKSADRRKDEEGRKSFADHMKEKTTKEEREKIREKTRNRTKRNRSRPRNRGGKGRTLDR